MRMTVNLGPDAYHFACAYAGGKGITLSAALNELVLRAGKVPEEIETGRLKMSEHGYLVISGSGNTITPEMVREASEDELL